MNQSSLKEQGLFKNNQATLEYSANDKRQGCFPNYKTKLKKKKINDCTLF